jgi:uncharacterized cupin superfamily protein
MTRKEIVYSPSDLALKPAPIEPSWVLEGNPVARNRELSHSPDWSAWTMVWDCTAGRFQWHYDIDETVHFIDGSVTISGDGMAARRFGPGDVVFFPAGSSATWHVDSYVRKVAFCRKTLPRPLEFFHKIYKGLRMIVRRVLRRGDKVTALEPAN